MLPGDRIEAIEEAILEAYDYDELKRLLRIQMNVRLEQITAPKAFATVVFDLIQWSERHTRVGELLWAAARGRTDNDALQQLYQQLGMANPINVRQGGRLALAAPRYASKGGLESILQVHTGFDNYRKWARRMNEVEGQVCRITIEGHPAGTGFLVGPDAVLTNHHVLSEVIQGRVAASQVQCEFDYHQLESNARSIMPILLATNDWLIDSSPPTLGELAKEPDLSLPSGEELDYALVRLASDFGRKPVGPNPGQNAPPRGWVRVARAAPEIQSRMPLLIPQHPDGQPLILAIDTDAINEELKFWFNQNKTRIRYATNTEPGASGSPCFDFKWNLIAVHQYGDRATDRMLGYNQGVPIEAIRRRVDRSTQLASSLGD